MKVGIVGLEGAGKKSLFSLLTGKDIEAHVQVKEEIGVVSVPDERIDFLAGMFASKKKVYSQIEFHLIPSVKKDSQETKKMLVETKFMDMIAIVARQFSDENVYHPLGNVDFQRDYFTLKNELLLADLMLVETRLDNIAKQLKAKSDTVVLKEKEVIEKLKTVLEQGNYLSSLKLTDEEGKIIKSLNFLTFKPVFVIINCDEDKVNTAFNLPDGAKSLNVSVKIEREIQGLAENEKKEFLDTLALTDTSINRLIKFAYSYGELISFITAGPKDSHSWTIRNGTNAHNAAGAIHSDIEKGFIRAEVVSFEDLKRAGSEAEAKKLGVYRLEGKEYIVKDGDIIVFRFNV
ncbi:MAG: YchF family ATPase [Elusimicrobia bacterium]|nr:YchF family ATPase [Candidatus Liberimonas magnetica]